MEVLKKGIGQVSIILLMAVLFYAIMTIGVSAKVQAEEIGTGTNTVVVQKGNTKNLFKASANFKNYKSSDTSIVEITNVNNDATKDGVSGSRVTIKAKKAGSAILTLTRNNDNKIYVIVAVAKTDEAYEFLSYVDTISTYMQNHSSKFKKASSPSKSTFSAAKTAVSNGNTVSVNCVTPAYWTLNKMGLTSGSFYISTGGSVHGLKSNSYLTKKTSGDAIGKGVKAAASADLLLPGDIIGNSTFTHTFIYFGLNRSGNPLVYESGGDAFSKGLANVGCGPFNHSQYNGTDIKIKTILRWK